MEQNSFENYLDPSKIEVKIREKLDDTLIIFYSDSLFNQINSVILPNINKLSEIGINLKYLMVPSSGFSNHHLFNHTFVLFILDSNDSQISTVLSLGNFPGPLPFTHLLFNLIINVRSKDFKSDINNSLILLGAKPFYQPISIQEDELFETIMENKLSDSIYRLLKKQHKIYGLTLPNALMLSTVHDLFYPPQVVQCFHTEDIEDMINDSIINNFDDENNLLGRQVMKSDMLTSNQKKVFTKQGYKLVGSHSAIKQCRWNKNQIKGNGACYKHTFYNIESYLCMESTFSMACANRCIFCWRHHKNPVGKQWRWLVDSPETIVNKMLEEHGNIMKQSEQLKGANIEKIRKGYIPRHIALSLIGESVIYPHINEAIDILHQKGISTFMVTNAQFPDMIKTLRPVTQLYISVSAGDESTMSSLDQPLFPDFWERYNRSLEILSTRMERTVLRFTLIKDYNMSNIADYVNLVNKSQPDFIELKGMTYFGDNNGITMRNCPWHQDIVEFAQNLVSNLEYYQISCEHVHSCCVLVTNTKFKINGVWNTWINFDKFFQLYENYLKFGTLFTSLEYSAPTPEWCLFGSGTGGFDPDEHLVSHSGKTRDEARIEQEEESDECQCLGDANRK